MHRQLPDFEKEFDNHRLVSFITSPKSNLKGFIAIHRGNITTPAFGATRIVTYANEYEALTDALKLSKLMSYKAALAGVTYGGAKGVIIDSTASRDRRKLLTGYAEKVHLLGGHFITGADVGITAKDVKFMRNVSPYFVGTASDPVVCTAHGVYKGIEVCLEAVYGTESLQGRTFAIQGLGKIGSALLALIYHQAQTIYVADTDEARIKTIKKMYPKVTVVSPKEIFKQSVDVFAPCALSNAISLKIISKLRCKIIAGGANSQLETHEIGTLLHDLGIVYAPDYVINAGGLIAVVDEYEHKGFNEARVLKRIDGIKLRLKHILRESVERRQGTNVIADTLAEHIFNQH